MCFEQNCQRTQVVHSKDTWWVIWQVSFEQTHNLPTDQIEIKVVGKFWKNSQLTHWAKWEQIDHKLSINSQFACQVRPPLPPVCWRAGQRGGWAVCCYQWDEGQSKGLAASLSLELRWLSKGLCKREVCMSGCSLLTHSWSLVFTEGCTGADERLVAWGWLKETPSSTTILRGS